MKNYREIILLCLLTAPLISLAQDKKDMAVDTFALSEVKVTAQRPLVRQKTDRMVVSVEHSKLLQGRSLNNILKLIPGVDYDDNGGITVMGKSVVVYENGRKVTLSGKKLDLYLKSIRGKDLKDLEFLPQSTAEYDAEGGAGVMVINRQKRHEYGLSGYVGSEYDRRRKNSFSEFGNITYSWGDIALYADFTMGQDAKHNKVTESDEGVSSLTRSFSNTIDRGRYYTPKAGMDFFLSPQQYLGVEWSGNYSKDYSHNGWMETTIVDGDRLSALHSLIPYTARPKNNNVTMNYEWKTDTLGSTLKVVADYAGMREDDDWDFENTYHRPGLADSLVAKHQPSHERIDIFTAQADYTQWLGKHSSLTVGAKYVNVGTDYASHIYQGNGTLADAMTEDPLLHDDFHYGEQRTAAYGMYKWEDGPWGINAGLREEYTQWHSRQRVGDLTEHSQHELRLFPSLFVSRRFGDGNALRFSYSQSVNRPSYQMVNPFVFYISEVSRKEGNPDLKSELFYSGSVGLVLRGKYMIYLMGSYGDRRFNEVYEQIDAIHSRYTLRNDGSVKTLSLWTSAPLSWGLWSSQNSFMLTGNIYENSVKTVHSLNYLFTSNHRFRLMKRFTAMVNLRFYNREKRLYLIQKSDFYGIDVEGDYSCWNDRLDINFGVKDLLNSRGGAKQLIQNGDYSHYTEYDNCSRNLFVSLTYSFNAGTKHASSRQKSHSNQEEKNRM